MFREDYQNGVIAENIFADFLIKGGKKVLKTYGMNKDFDVATYDEDRILDTYEVKFDILYPKTGNLAIEYAFKGSRSGILTTKAKYWVEVVKTPVMSKIYVLEVSGFKDWLRQNKEYLKTTKGGDNLDSMMILLKPNDIINNFFCNVYENN